MTLAPVDLGEEFEAQDQEAEGKEDEERELLESVGGISQGLKSAWEDKTSPTRRYQALSSVLQRQGGAGAGAGAGAVKKIQFENKPKFISMTKVFSQNLVLNIM